MDNTNKFSGKAENYVKARPDYPKVVFNYLKSELVAHENSVFADIGAGTGIFTKKLLDCGCTVFAVEPNSDMRSALKNSIGGSEKLFIVDGTDKYTGLSGGSVDFVSAAQAFHWFDVHAFKKECLRILKPGGYVILVWNTRKNDSELIKENAEICHKYCPDFTGFSGGKRNSKENIDEFFCKNYQTVKFKNDLIYNKEKFIERMLSASYSLTEKDEKYAEYIKALEEFFEINKNDDGLLFVPNETVLYAGKL